MTLFTVQITILYSLRKEQPLNPGKLIQVPLAKNIHLETLRHLSP